MKFYLDKTSPIASADVLGDKFIVGDKAQSATRTITESDIGAFAGLTGDYNEIHTSEEFSKKGYFGKRIAHGLLGLSIASGLATRMGFMSTTVEMFRSVEWEFTAPIFIGDTVRIEAEVVELKAFPRLKNGRVIFKVSLLNQRDEVTQRGTWSVMVKSKPAE